jgi:hypothetical protein
MSIFDRLSRMRGTVRVCFQGFERVPKTRANTSAVSGSPELAKKGSGARTLTADATVTSTGAQSVTLRAFP